MPQKEIDYSKTVIYKIVCNDLNIKDLYVGSTTNFTQRKGQHKNNCCNEESEGHHRRLYKFIRENSGWENWSIIEIEKFPCNDKNEGLARERYWLETLKANLNTAIPTRSKKEYRKYNKASIYEQRKKYREANKQTIAAKKKEYREKNIEVIAAKKKIYREANKDIIKAKKCERHECGCGKLYTFGNKHSHFKTKYHLEWENEQNKGN